MGDVRQLSLPVGGPDHLAHRQVERLRKVVVALVVSGDGHDRARAVVGEDVVGDVDRDPLTVDRVDRVQTREDTRLLDRRRALLGLLRRGMAHIRLYLLRLDPRNELVLGREHEERCPEERVRPCGEDGDVLAPLLDQEVDLGALGASDPVPLARFDRLGPIDGVEVVEQGIRVVRDPEEPLLHHARLDGAPQRSQVPSASTCSFASTVWSLGHHFTGAPLR